MVSDVITLKKTNMFQKRVKFWCATRSTFAYAESAYANATVTTTTTTTTTTVTRSQEHYIVVVMFSFRLLH